MLIAASLVLISQSTQTYVIDVFTLHAASGSFGSFASSVPDSSFPFCFTALAVVFCLRTLAGFGFPLFAPAMFGALGHGKGCTVLAVVSIALGCPAYVYVCVITLDLRLMLFISADLGFFGSMGNG